MPTRRRIAAPQGRPRQASQPFAGACCHSLRRVPSPAVHLLCETAVVVGSGCARGVCCKRDVHVWGCAFGGHFHRAQKPQLHRSTVEAFYFLCCRSRGGICVWCALSFDAERVATSHMLTKQLSMFRGAKNRCQYVQLAMTLALCQVWRRQHPITAHLRPGLTIPRTPGKTERERHKDVRLRAAQW